MLKDRLWASLIATALTIAWLWYRSMFDQVLPQINGRAGRRQCGAGRVAAICAGPGPERV